MTGHVLAVIVVTTFLAHSAPAPGNVAPAPAPIPVSEDDVGSMEGRVLSYDAGTLVLLSSAGERVRFALSLATEIPAPLVSGMPVIVEFVERERSTEMEAEADVALDALVVYLALPGGGLSS